MRRKLVAGVMLGALAAVAWYFLALRGREDAEVSASIPGLADSAEAGEAAPDAPKRAENESPRQGLAAVEHAAKAGKYLFIFFYKEDGREAAAMRKVFRAAMAKASERAEWMEAKVTDPAQRALVAKFNVSRAPMPLALAVAPSGAVTGGFPVDFDEGKLLGAIVSRSVAECLGALQQRKLVFLCVQNKTTESNAEAMQGVSDFNADARYAKTTEIITVDPAGADDAAFLRRLRVDTGSKQATTVFLAPPGTVVGNFQGATSKKELVAALQKAMADCATGCGPSSGAG